MHAITAKKVIVFFIAVFSMSFMVGCAHMDKAPKDRPGYLYYHKPLPEAAIELEEARLAGKDRECPAEFNDARDMVDRAYEIYMECRTQEAIDMANVAIGKIKALCPPKPVAVVKPEPMPVTPPPAPMPEPTPPPPVQVAEPVKVVLEDIHFDFDKATLTAEAQAILKRNVKTLKDNAGIKVQIEGHTCAHGSEGHNAALGERRAFAVQEYLVQQGIAADRLSAISYGETRLAMPETPTAHNKESKEAKTNRRVHFEVIVK
ncbi:MAG: OmpA family protein [Thermodesulfovibrionales bacterium]